MFGRLLQFEVAHRGMKIRVEICENKLLEVLNSKLIRSYCIFDPRFRQLAIYLKAWNKLLTPHKNDRLNSFSVCLLLLGFMIQNKYLPNLQKLGIQAKGMQTVDWTNSVLIDKVKK
jgi:DNA polymerase sigma